MKTLLKNITPYEREKIDGKYVRNKCGRDFLFYSLHYYYPEEFNPQRNNPKDIDNLKLFGYPTPAFLAWTQVQFMNIAQVFLGKNLKISINGLVVKNFFDFVHSIVFSKMSYDLACREIELCVDSNIVSGIDISLGFFGLLDHVVFVYGYDENNFYVYDTHHVENLEYIPYRDHPFLFILPREIVKKRWTRFGRVWRVSRA